MKLVIAVVQGEDAQRTVEALGQAGISSTRISSTGGFLQQGNVTLLIGIDEEKVANAVHIIRKKYRRIIGTSQLGNCSRGE